MKLDDVTGGNQRKIRVLLSCFKFILFSSILCGFICLYGSGEIIYSSLVFSPATDKFEVVECDLEKPGQIRPALGNSSVVICCIGASEKEIFDITGPYRIDYQATKNLIDAGMKSIPLV